MAESAARTCSRASPTALSGRPTTRKAGRPLAALVCTSTDTAWMAEKTKLRTRTTPIRHSVYIDKGTTVLLKGLSIFSRDAARQRLRLSWEKQLANRRDRPYFRDEEQEQG